MRREWQRAWVIFSMLCYCWVTDLDFECKNTNSQILWWNSCSTTFLNEGIKDEWNDSIHLRIKLKDRSEKEHGEKQLKSQESRFVDPSRFFYFAV